MLFNLVVCSELNLSGGPVLGFYSIRFTLFCLLMFEHPRRVELRSIGWKPIIIADIRWMQCTAALSTVCTYPLQIDPYKVHRGSRSIILQAGGIIPACSQGSELFF